MILNVVVLEVTMPVPDVEPRSPVDEETEYVVVVVVESGLAFDVAEEAGVLLTTEPENVDIGCVGLLLRDDTDILMQNGSEQDCDAEVGVGDLLELAEDRFGLVVIRLAWEDTVDAVLCVDIEILMHSKSAQDGEAEV